MHAWTSRSRESVRTLMDYQRIHRTEVVALDMCEIVLIVGEEENRGLWMKGKIFQRVTGRDGVMQRAVILSKGNHLERPLQLLCLLEIRSELPAETPVVQRKEEVFLKRE